MKQAKKEYNKYKEKFPNRSPNEIDFGLGFKAALEWTRELPLQENGPSKPKDLIKCIEEELGIKSYD